ncbi:hypothetical protein FACS189483_05060 [Spirochaetia bacterium]|nr:hypothetical protein FACS189483_05060 [Spirochaetia bacterium]
MEYMGILIPFVALSIPIIAIVLSHKQKTQKNNLREFELKKEILELEIQKQNTTIKLLEEENKKYDQILDKNDP